MAFGISRYKSIVPFADLKQNRDVDVLAGTTPPRFVNCTVAQYCRRKNCPEALNMIATDVDDVVMVITGAGGPVKRQENCHFSEGSSPMW